jgi:hypothetical protein
MELNGTHQILAYTDDADLVSHNTYTRAIRELTSSELLTKQAMRKK